MSKLSRYTRNSYPAVFISEPLQITSVDVSQGRNCCPNNCPGHVYIKNVYTKYSTKSRDS